MTEQHLDDEDVAAASRSLLPNGLYLADQYWRVQGGRPSAAKFGPVDLHA